MNITEKLTKGRFRPLLLCLFFGMMGAIPYFCGGAFIFTFISIFGQIWIVTEISKEKQRIFLPFLFYFFGTYVLIYSFLSKLYPYSQFGFTKGEALLTLICSCFLIPLYHAFLQASCMLLLKSAPQNAWRIPFYGLTWIICEWILSIGVLAFPWPSVTISLTGFLPYIQTISLLGKYFITFITVSGLAAIVYSLHDKKRLYALIGGGAILLNTIAGTVMYFVPEDASGVTENIACIQGDVRSNEKWDYENRGSIQENYLSLVDEAAENGANLVVLPETAIPQTFTKTNNLYKAYAKRASEHNITIIAGVNYSDSDNYYNGVVAIYPDGSLSEVYGKRHLVPFGEYVPYADLLGSMFPFLAEMNEDENNLTVGEKAVCIKIDDDTSVAPLVCFDSIFPSLSRDSVKEGANVIAVVTNDSWFEDSIGCETHLRNSILRAIENRKPIIRAANTGISAFIDSKGNTNGKTNVLERDILYGSINETEGGTLYTKTGDIILYVAFAAEALIIILNLIRRIKNGKNTTS